MSEPVAATTAATAPIAPPPGADSSLDDAPTTPTVPPTAEPTDVEEQTFDKVTSAENTRDKVVLVDFFAEWCMPCKVLSPLLEEFTADSSDTRTGSGRTIDLLKVDVDEQPILAQQCKVRAMPTVIAYRDGKEADRFVGALPKDDILKFLNKL